MEDYEGEANQPTSQMQNTGDNVQADSNRDNEVSVAVDSSELTYEKTPDEQLSQIYESGPQKVQKANNTVLIIGLVLMVISIIVALVGYYT